LPGKSKTLAPLSNPRLRLAARWLLRVCAAALLMLLAYLLLGPPTSVETKEGHDKIAHVVAFAAATWCLAILLPSASRLRVAMFAIALGGLTELLQQLSRRDPSVMDFVADALGVALALAIWTAVRAVSPRRRTR